MAEPSKLAALADHPAMKALEAEMNSIECAISNAQMAALGARVNYDQALVSASVTLITIARPTHGVGQFSGAPSVYRSLEILSSEIARVHAILEQLYKQAQEVIIKIGKRAAELTKTLKDEHLN